MVASERQAERQPREIVRQVTDGASTLTVTVTRDARLRKSVRWTLHE